MTPTPATNPPLRLHFLDGLRGVAALYVMFGHAWLIIWPDMRFAPRGVTGALTTWLAFGHVAVAVFIVVSGFCLALPVVKAGGELRGGARRFFARRAKRIIPPYYFAIALSSILLATLIGQPTGSRWDFSIPFGGRDWIHSLVTHVFFLNDFWDVYKLNGVFWSIAVEWQIYFLFPPLVILWRRISPLAATLIAVVLSFAAAWWTRDWAMDQRFIQFVGLFALGMLGAHVAFAPQCAVAIRKIPLAAIFGLSAAAAVGICLTGPAAALGQWLLPLDFLVGVATIAWIVRACLCAQNQRRVFLSGRPIVFVGEFSYSLYLIHFPLLQVIWQYAIAPRGLDASAAFALLALAGAPLVVFAAFIFFLACERPFLNRRPA
jgi:peptidoglycan/LPS O-acetylase OafA/YrhL